MYITKFSYEFLSNMDYRIYKMIKILVISIFIAFIITEIVLDFLCEEGIPLQITDFLFWFIILCVEIAYLYYLGEHEFGFTFQRKNPNLYIVLLSLGIVTFIAYEVIVQVVYNNFSDCLFEGYDWVFYLGEGIIFLHFLWLFYGTLKILKSNRNRLFEEGVQSGSLMAFGDGEIVVTNNGTNFKDQTRIMRKDLINMNCSVCKKGFHRNEMILLFECKHIQHQECGVQCTLCIGRTRCTSLIVMRTFFKE